MCDKFNPMTITVPIYWQQSKKKTVLVGLNWYRNAHFMALNKAKKHYSTLITDFKPFKGDKIHIHYNVYLKRRGTDGGNVRAVIEKFMLDALVKNGIITNDTADIIISDSANYYFDKTNPRCEIKLIAK